MTQKLRILVLEDRATDYELNLRELRRAGSDFTARRVETESQFRTQLQQFAPDLILADHSLPTYDGLSALGVARREHPDVPFVFVTGTLGEETAVETGLQLKPDQPDHLPKPFTAADFAAKVRACLDSQ